MPAINTVLADRQRTHGDFTSNALVSQQLKLSLHYGTNWPDLPLVYKEALEVICAKMARIVCGNSNELDHWRDIIGYATLILNLLERGDANE